MSASYYPIKSFNRVFKTVINQIQYCVMSSKQNCEPRIGR